VTRDIHIYNNNNNNNNNIIIFIIIIIFLSPLCRVFTVTYLKQTMFLGYIMLQLFRIYEFLLHEMLFRP